VSIGARWERQQGPCPGVSPTTTTGVTLRGNAKAHLDRGDRPRGRDVLSPGRHRVRRSERTVGRCRRDRECGRPRGSSGDGGASNADRDPDARSGHCRDGAPRVRAPGRCGTSGDRGGRSCRLDGAGMADGPSRVSLGAANGAAAGLSYVAAAGVPHRATVGLPHRPSHRPSERLADRVSECSASASVGPPRAR
jgi:hypothetical protein